MFKLIRNGIKLRVINKLLREMCGGRSCHNCPARIDGISGPGYTCAQCYILNQALEKWGLNKEGVLR